MSAKVTKRKTNKLGATRWWVIAFKSLRSLRLRIFVSPILDEGAGIYVFLGMEQGLTTTVEYAYYVPFFSYRVCLWYPFP